ncbi:MAG: NAD(+)/NADH kinase [Nanoarchaeota archaeon]|nr:NAD(+)/NADH kinase [Nanoarchaeota archaeon]MCG2717227.1 hypothetical protein [Nanoarchaeota archaeon]
MKVSIVGLNRAYFEREIKKSDSLTFSKDDPDVVIAFGGDGTLLYGETKYPGVPKLFVRHSSKCKKCSNHNYKKVIDSLVNDDFKIKEFVKIKASVRGNELVGLNDVNIHYKPPCAIRLNIDVDKKNIAKEIISDGIVVSTSYGSSGYFYSITRKTFSKGLGIAFNNPVKPMDYKIIPETSVINVEVVRGPGVMCVDCNPKVIALKDGDIIKIQKSSHVARILMLKGKRMVKI